MTKIKNKDKFNFFIPATIIKGGSEEEEMIIEGICSTTSEDADQEVLDPTGFDLQPLLASGFFNYNHQGNTDSSAIIGEPTEAKVVNKGKELYIKGYLYPDSEQAKSTYTLAQVLAKNSKRGSKLGFSIEGHVLQRDPLNKKKILKAVVTGCAVTPYPKNSNTWLSIVKGEYANAYEPFETEEEEDKVDPDKIQKDMSVANNPELVAEDIDGVKKKFKRAKKNVAQDNEDTYLSKAKFYNEILKSYPNASIKELTTIYDLCREVQNSDNNNTSNDMSEISKSALQKVQDLLKKAKESSAMDSKEEDYEERMKKAKECVKDMWKGHMDTDSFVNEICEECDITMDDAQDLVGAFKEKMSEIFALGILEVLDSEAHTAADGQDLKNTNRSNNNGPAPMLRKGEESDILVKSMEGIAEALVKISESNQKLSERMKKFEEQPIRKSITTGNTAFKERFEKSVNDAKNNGATVYSLSNVNDINQLADELFEKGGLGTDKQDDLLIKAAGELQIAKQLDPGTARRIMPRLKSLNIVVTA